jgi:hypothetical protein
MVHIDATQLIPVLVLILIYFLPTDTSPTPPSDPEER